MKKEMIARLFQQFEEAAYNYKGIECWSARELQAVFHYSEWRNFLKVIEKAKTSCRAAGEALSDHFVDIKKMVTLGSGSAREIEDIALTRYACYLVAQNGDPSKPSVAFAQTYFAVQTRKQEIIEQRLLDVARVSARDKLTRSEKKLSGILYERWPHHHISISSPAFAIASAGKHQHLPSLLLRQAGIITRLRYCFGRQASSPAFAIASAGRHHHPPSPSLRQAGIIISSHHHISISSYHHINKADSSASQYS